MDAHPFAEHFFDGGFEGGFFRVREAGESEVCGGQAAEERTAVVGLREGDFVVCCQGAPECVGV